MTDYKLVPVEPTEKMLWAGRSDAKEEMNKAFHPDNPDPLAVAYAAMLAAAPSPAWLSWRT